MIYQPQTLAGKPVSCTSSNLTLLSVRTLGFFNLIIELSQTAVRAPADGYVTVVALTVGDRALQARSAMSFIVENEITIVGMFSQNGFQTIKPGAPVDIVFDNAPGRIYHAKITAIPKGVGQGQVAVSGTLARTTALGGTSAFPAEITIPEEMSRESLRLGMSGNATAFAGNAGVIGLLASILVDQRLYRLPVTAANMLPCG
jgi:multidrug resistance efflux pump